MFKNILQNKNNSTSGQQGGIFILLQSQNYLKPILTKLNSQIDKRLIGILFSPLLVSQNRKAVPRCLDTALQS